MFFLAALMKDVANKETKFQPLNPLESRVIRHFRRCNKSISEQVKKKPCLLRETKVQGELLERLCISSFYFRSQMEIS